MNRTKRNKKWLEEKYLIEGLDIYQIAPLCQCHPRTIHQWLIKFKIPRRKGGWRVMPEEQKELRRQWAKDHPEINRMKGKSHSAETKKAMSQSRKGQGNANWKGGLTSPYYLHHNGKQWDRQRKECSARDNWTCRICGTQSKRLHAHHIIPWLLSKDDDLENLVTICTSCHSRKNFMGVTFLAKNWC